MPRFKLIVEYDGTPFSGWQAQADFPTVQVAIETAIHAISGETVRISCAGRTDRGVHATGQVAHADLTKDWNPGRLRDGLNALLRPLPVSIVAVEKAEPGFDARFSARRRVYRYAIFNRRAPPALLQNRVWHVMRPLDADVMHRAAQLLLGHHDFTTFRNVDCQAKSPVKTLLRLDVWREGDLVLFETEARSFLHNQVRSMVGSLKRVGDGGKPEQWIGDILAARQRALCGALAPPEGLTLIKVRYDGGLDPEQRVADLTEEESDDEV